MDMPNFKTEENFLTLIKKSAPPFDYEKQVFNDHFKHVVSTLNGESPPPMK